LTLQQQKEELKRKLQMLSSKGKPQKKDGGIPESVGFDLQAQDDDDDEGARLRRKQTGKFILNDFKFLSTLGTGTFGRVRLVKHKSEPAEAEPLALKCLKKSEIIRLK
jgi:serine/threonine protein kinase